MSYSFPFQNTKTFRFFRKWNWQRTSDSQKCYNFEETASRSDSSTSTRSCTSTNAINRTTSSHKITTSSHKITTSSHKITTSSHKITTSSHKITTFKLSCAMPSNRSYWTLWTQGTCLLQVVFWSFQRVIECTLLWILKIVATCECIWSQASHSNSRNQVLFHTHACVCTHSTYAYTHTQMTCHLMKH